jgi:hypothetical protein
MDSLVLTGNDTIVFNDHVMNDLSVADVATVEFPNNLATIHVGKNGNALMALNETGNQADFELRILRGSNDDKYLQNRLNSQRNDFTGFTALSGSFVKKLGDGAGNVSSDTYIFSGGIFQKQNSVKSNVEGEASQAETIYKMQFAKCARVIG